MYEKYLFNVLMVATFLLSACVPNNNHEEISKSPDDEIQEVYGVVGGYVPKILPTWKVVLHATQSQQNESFSYAFYVDDETRLRAVRLVQDDGCCNNPIVVYVYLGNPSNYFIDTLVATDRKQVDAIIKNASVASLRFKEGMSLYDGRLLSWVNGNEQTMPKEEHLWQQKEQEALNQVLEIFDVWKNIQLKDNSNEHIAANEAAIEQRKKEDLVGYCINTDGRISREQIIAHVHKSFQNHPASQDIESLLGIIFLSPPHAHAIFHVIYEINASSTHTREFAFAINAVRTCLEQEMSPQDLVLSQQIIESISVSTGNTENIHDTLENSPSVCSKEMQLRNEQRKKDVNTLLIASWRYAADHDGKFAFQIPEGKEVEICSEKGQDCDNLVRLNDLLGTYIQAIPADPQSTSPDRTGYYLFHQNGSLTVIAKKAECEAISVVR